MPEEIESSGSRIERWRAERKARVQDAANRRRTPYVAAGIDLKKAFEAYRKLPPFKGNLGKVKLVVAHRSFRGTRGTAWIRRRKLRVAVGPGATQSRVLEVLVHEMCHLVLPVREGHSERFRRTFARACQEIWGIEVPIDCEPYMGVVAYGMGEFAARKLRELIEAGEIDTFPPDSVPVASKKVRLDALVEQRAEHAARMLARAERRAKLAQRLLTKWRTKVRYYERAAAKRASKGTGQ